MEEADLEWDDNHINRKKKKKIVSILGFLTTVAAFSQSDFQGVATYESKTDVKSFNISFPGIPQEQQDAMKAKMAKAFEKTFELKFNTTESIYAEPQKLTMNSNSLSATIGGDFSKYKNLKDKVIISETDLMDKPFLVSEKFPEYNWQILSDTKTIGTYVCQKAQLIIPVSAEERAEYEQEMKENESKSTNLLSIIEPKEKIITAWYATEIPISNGPDDYWGLPGLILEVNDGTTIMLCSKIVLNPKEKFQIKKPKKGKPITRKVFEKLSEEKFESMKNKDGVIELNVSPGN